MMDFITGLIIGQNIKNNNTITKPIEQEIQPIIIEEPKILGYVPIPEIYDFDATIDSGDKDYNRQHMITLVKDGHIYYYLEVYTPISQKMYGYQKILRNI